MEIVIYIIGALFASFLFIINPVLAIIVGGGAVLILWLIYDVVKSAVKAALREYEKEKSEQKQIAV